MKYGTDYSKTAIQLNNPNEVLGLLLAWDKARQAYIIAAAEYDKACANLPEAKAYNEAVNAADKAREAVKEAIDRAGSYQDITVGLYALKQGRTGITYDPAKVRERLPMYADAVIEEAVDGTKIHGLRKGKLITDEDLAAIEVRTNLSPAYVIEVIKREAENAD